MDTTRRRVDVAYGILQQRIVTPLPQPQEATPFHWLFAGQCGIDPYSAASSEVYQDVFGIGSFSGKGLLHVQALHAVLGGRLPEDLVLSHDLLEGAIVRRGGVSYVTLIEDAPMRADVAAAHLVGEQCANPRLAVVFCFLWVGTQLWVWWASRRQRPRPVDTLTAEDHQYLLGVAHDTWLYFGTHVGPASYHLPPDNVQTLPQTTVAQRISPTNIGLYLLSLACARRFGWLTRSEQTLATLAKLDRYRGHFERLRHLQLAGALNGLCVHRERWQPVRLPVESGRRLHRMAARGRLASAQGSGSTPAPP